MTSVVDLVQSKNILLNKQEYKVNTNEYNPISHPEYFSLNILDQLGFHERQISLLCELAALFEEKLSLIHI